MASSPTSRLTPLQRDLLDGFFARERRFFLTGGAALAGFYFGHRDTEDLDLFAPPGPDLREAEQAVLAAAARAGATTRTLTRYPDFCRITAHRSGEECLVDLVIDRAPMVDPAKAAFGAVRVDTLRGIAANKICTLLSRSEIKDLVDLQQLVERGLDLESAFDDAQKKDGSADPATLAWVLGQLSIHAGAVLPGGVSPAALLAFRDDLVGRLSALAFARVRRR